jgi:hypothetical protein
MGCAQRQFRPERRAENEIGLLATCRRERGDHGGEGAGTTIAQSGPDTQMTNKIFSDK